ncbi:phospho-N-acetylmuramoyl-pentapeptide-transferase [Halothermothrix orenii]|uniref:Phospho-N-acetylmuramoyl-pentapeptide-transferase n=1 Tax=Halothermothrix orenii (strain H 168 / OCM 544 / DSM 9562) TaxID=373903 RepID=B8CWJ3_HALOH|nr:phospho-N-acetylmuramoyl-pentapeptide-transferase [Halothermothrix orenii]ACL69662.1 phospho-N-acetylmuramoyl-pentapeptide-transferase [Halothermothrix orenii H 168]
MEYFVALCVPFLILMIFGRGLIKLLKILNFGQQVRNEGPKSHLNKEGIPTMGGVLIILAILVTSLIFVDLKTPVIWALITTTGMGLVGFFDDIIKVRTRRSLGLRAREKLAGQVLFGLLLALYVYYYSDIGSTLIIPVSGQVIDLGYVIIPFIIVVVIGTANAVNLTDGLDGLAAGVTLIVASAFAVITSGLGLQGLTCYSLIISGACLGFIWYNSHPAQVFMGDVGSLALGGAIASIAVLSRTELFLLIIGAVYVVETLSVIIQVIYFRLTGGKRVFKMTPIHHHFELSGLAESKVVARFWIISLIFAVLGIISFYLIGS